MREELASIKEKLDQQMQDGTFVAMKKVEYATSFVKQVFYVCSVYVLRSLLLCCLPFCTFGVNDITACECFSRRGQGDVVLVFVIWLSAFCHL